MARVTERTISDENVEELLILNRFDFNRFPEREENNDSIEDEKASPGYRESFGTAVYDLDPIQGFCMTYEYPLYGGSSQSAQYHGQKLGRTTLSRLRCGIRE